MTQVEALSEVGRGCGSSSWVAAVYSVVEGRYGSRLNADTPLYRAALGPLIVANSAGTPLGLGRAALEAFLERLPGRGITFTTYADQREAPVTHLQVGEAAIRLESAAHHARRGAEIVDARARDNEPYTQEERASCAWISPRPVPDEATGACQPCFDTRRSPVTEGQRPDGKRQGTLSA